LIYFGFKGMKPDTL